MELNRIRLYGKIIDLEVGDVFWSNDLGKTVYYSPKGKNVNNIPRGSDQWRRSSYISCQKYQKQILSADNLEKFENKPGHYRTEWVVKYVYKEDPIEHDDLLLMEINWKEFKVTEVKVERETEKLLFVTPHLPITYGTKIEKKQLLKVLYHYGKMYGMARPEDYHKLEKLLFEGYTNQLKEDRQRLQDSLNKNQEFITAFELLKESYGYTLFKRTKQPNSITKHEKESESNR